MRKAIIATCVAVPLLMGNNGGCDYADLPTMQQIEFYVPKSIQTCPYAPRSPGRNATRQQTAVYIAGLYNAWQICHGTVKQRTALYLKWKASIARQQKR